MTGKNLIAALAAILVSGSALAAEEGTSSPFTSLAEMDRAVALATTEERRALAQAEALGARNKDDAAMVILEELRKKELPPDVKVELLENLASLHLRAGRFSKLREFLEELAVLAPDAKGDRGQVLLMARALSAIPAMTVDQSSVSKIALKRDFANLPRFSVQVQEESIDGVLDTGAGFCTASRSFAEKAKVRILPDAISVNDSTENRAGARLGIAEQLTVGKTVFRNVVLLVLPDDALTFLGGLYKIDFIVGAPVILGIKKLAISSALSGSELIVGEAFPSTSPTPISLRGQKTYVDVAVGEEAVVLPFFLDTGAKRSMLEAGALSRLAGLAATATGGGFRVQGIGGTKDPRDAQKLPKVELRLGERVVQLKDVMVVQSKSKNGLGVLGQDVLGTSAGFSLDYETMQLVLK